MNPDDPHSVNGSSEEEEPKGEIVTEEAIEIETLPQFLYYFKLWHGEKVKEAEHLMTTPEGVMVQVDEQPDRPFAGEFKEGYLAGLSTALAIFKQLPFEDMPDTLEEKPPGVTSH